MKHYIFPTFIGISFILPNAWVSKSEAILYDYVPVAKCMILSSQITPIVVIGQQLHLFQVLAFLLVIFSLASKFQNICHV
jgi:hypothetical protein